MSKLLKKKIKSKAGALQVTNQITDGEVLSPAVFKQLTDHLQQEANKGKLDELFKVAEVANVTNFSIKFDK